MDVQPILNQVFGKEKKGKKILKNEEILFKKTNSFKKRAKYEY